MSETVDQLRIHDRWKVLDAENLLSQKFDYMEFNKVLDTFSNHSTTIINYFEERLTNASAESFNAKIKAFRNQLRGVADVKFFLFRLAMLYA